MLPDIKIALPVLFVLWCVGSVWAMHSTVMLAYPAMWATVALLFYVVSKATSGGSHAEG